jgi:hypothetical protein
MNDGSHDYAPIAATNTAPMGESIEPREAEVKKEALMEPIKVIAVNDLESGSAGRKGERPVGVPAAHGHWGDGGADIRGALGAPNTREYAAGEWGRR